MTYGIAHKLGAGESFYSTILQKTVNIFPGLLNDILIETQNAIATTEYSVRQLNDRYLWANSISNLNSLDSSQKFHS